MKREKEMETADSMYERARQNLVMNDYGSAIRILGEMSDTYPADIRAHKAYIGCWMNKPEWIPGEVFLRIFNRAVYLDKSIASIVESRISKLCEDAVSGRINLEELMINCGQMKGHSPSLDALLKETGETAIRANAAYGKMSEYLSDKTNEAIIKQYFSYHSGIGKRVRFENILNDMAYTVETYYDDGEICYCHYYTQLKAKYSNEFMMDCLKKTASDCAERLCPECRKGKIKKYSSKCTACGKYISYQPYKKR